MSKSKNDGKPLSDKELDKTAGGGTVHESLERRIEEAELEKVSGAGVSDPRRGIPGEIFGPKKRN